MGCTFLSGTGSGHLLSLSEEREEREELLREEVEEEREEGAEELRVTEEASRLFSLLVLLVPLVLLTLLSSFASFLTSLVSFLTSLVSFLTSLALPFRVWLERLSWEETRPVRLPPFAWLRRVVYTSSLFAGRLPDAGRICMEPKSERMWLWKESPFLMLHEPV